MTTLPKILIIDDEPIIRDTIESLLSFEDLEFLFAESGEAGLEMAQQHHPDVIMLDVMMPGIDGFETCRKIRALPGLAEIPILMITALDDRDARLTGFMAGADDFLSKPFDGLEIQIRIKNIMRLNRYRSLVAERSRFHWVVENAEKGYIILTEGGTIQYANKKAQVYFNLPADYTNFDFAAQLGRTYQRIEGTSESNITYLLQPESPTARAFWLRMETLNSPLVKDGLRLIQITDVTDEMSTQQDIRKMHFLVAHKLRTPVALIYSSMNLLDLKMDMIPDAEVKPLVKTAWKGTERLVNEVREILKYIDAPIALSHGNPISLAEICRLIAATGEILELKDVDIAMEEALGDIHLRITSSAMELILHEILGNSKKFHPEQSPSVQAEIEADGENQVMIQITDNGQSLTAEQIARAMLPYSQGEKWFTGEMSGLGLGVPLVASLIWQAGGELSIGNCHIHPGVCVRIVLPVAKPA